MNVHLVVVQGAEMKLAVEGPFGCDYAWNDDYTAYRCLPHRWIPGSDSSYLAYQAGDYDNYVEPRDPESFAPVAVAPVAVDPSDDLPF